MGMTEPAGEQSREGSQLAQNHRVNPWLHQSPSPNDQNGTVLVDGREHEDGRCFMDTPFSPKAHPVFVRPSPAPARNSAAPHAPGWHHKSGLPRAVAV